MFSSKVIKKLDQKKNRPAAIYGALRNRGLSLRHGISHNGEQVDRSRYVFGMELSDSGGQGLVEYALVLALLVAILGGLLYLFGPRLQPLLQPISKVLGQRQDSPLPAQSPTTKVPGRDQDSSLPAQTQSLSAIALGLLSITLVAVTVCVIYFVLKEIAGNGNGKKH